MLLSCWSILPFRGEIPVLKCFFFVFFTVVTSATSSLSGPLSSLRGPMTSVTPDSAEVDLQTNVESALSKEVGFILLNLMDIFGTSFRVSSSIPPFFVCQKSMNRIWEWD